MPALHRVAAIALGFQLSLLVSGCLLDAGPYEGAGAGAAGSGTGGSSHGGSSATGGQGTGAGGQGTGGGTTSDSGGSTSSGGSTTSSTTTSTTSGCTSDGACPDPLDYCLTGSCTAGVCGEKSANEGADCGIAGGECWENPRCSAGTCSPVPKAFGAPVADFSYPDCKKIVCDGNGAKTEVNDDSDVPFNNHCGHDSCSGGQVVVTMQMNEGDACAFGAGVCCSGLCCIGGCGLCP